MDPKHQSEEKYRSELAFWQGWLGQHGPGERAGYYQSFMMNMGNVSDPSFFDGFVCLDIGCGPMGSLSWLRNAKVALGLDPLSEEYMQFDIGSHHMIYLKAPAEDIPLPSRYVDAVFSMNSLDHVDDLHGTCAEIRRVLKPGGYFLGSLNLHEPSTATEPWSLTEELLEEILFEGWEREFYSIRPKVEDGGDPYRYFFQPCPPELEKAEGPKALWCRFRTPY